MVEHFGGWQLYLETPFWTAQTHEWVWTGRQLAQAELNKRQADKDEALRRQLENN